jgi:hypothetical protein
MKALRRTCWQCQKPFIPASNSALLCSATCAAAFADGPPVVVESLPAPRTLAGKRPKLKKPRRDGQGYVVIGDMQQHRLVAAQILGRPLRREEMVHHINGDRADNRPENLAIGTHAQHNADHHMQRRATGAGQGALPYFMQPITELAKSASTHDIHGANQ